MSVAGILDAMRSTFSPAVRLVWQALENHANGARWWATTEAALATELNMSIATVSRAIIQLEQPENGIVRVERRKRRKSVFYMVRTYEKGSIHSGVNETRTEPPAEENMTGPEAPLTTQIVVSTEAHPVVVDASQSVVKPELNAQNVQQSPELTPQFALTLESTSKEDSTSKRESTSKSAARPAQRKVVVEHPRFAEFYLAYPRHVGRKAASDAYRAALAKGADPDALLEALRRQRFSEDWTKRPYPATWLNGERWTDQPEPPRAFDPSRLTGFAKAAWDLEQEIAAEPQQPPARRDLALVAA